MRTPPIVPQEETPPMLQSDMPPAQEETPPILQDDIPPMLHGETLTVLQGETPPILGSDIPTMLQGETPPVVLETDLTAVDSFLFAQPLETPTAPASAQYREMRGGRSHPCPTCDKTFTSAAYLRQHVVFHAPAKEFECEVCGKRYQNANSLHQHRRDCHSSGSPTKVACADCGQIFAAQRYLTEHRRRKHSAAFQRPACQVCGKSFAGRTELATHQSVHTGERPFACAVCGKTFRLRSVLRMHARQVWRLKKKPAQCFFFFFFVFLVFLFFFAFLYICPEERVFRVFLVSRILKVHPDFKL